MGGGHSEGGWWEGPAPCRQVGYRLGRSLESGRNMNKSEVFAQPLWGGLRRQLRQRRNSETETGRSQSRASSAQNRPGLWA